VKITPIEPTGTQRMLVHVNHADPSLHGFEDRDEPTYPKATIARGHQLRERRMAVGLTMGDVARRLSISVAQVSDIERGRSFIEEGQDEWDAVMERGLT
jgi:DNA-binding transcriptional regulator YiaG